MAIKSDLLSNYQQSSIYFCEDFRLLQECMCEWCVCVHVLVYMCVRERDEKDVGSAVYGVVQAPGFSTKKKLSKNPYSFWIEF